MLAVTREQRVKPRGDTMNTTNTTRFGTSRAARVAGLVASVLITIAIFGSVAVGLTWDAGASALI